MEELYFVEIYNGMEYGDFEVKRKLIVAENITDANEVAKEFMDQNFETNFKYDWIPSFVVTLIDEVDGYKITVEKNGG